MREKIAAHVKVSKEMLKGFEADDFIKEQLTYQLYAFVEAAAKEEGDITVHIEPPSFLDWLLRRRKIKTVHYVIKHLAKIDQRDTLSTIQF